MIMKPPSGFLRYDKTEDGWELVRNVELPGGEPTLELNYFLREGEGYVSGAVMMERAEEVGSNAGQLHAERMLDQQDRRIPAEWREHFLIFAGTVWRDPDGGLCVPILYWRRDGWDLDWYWLDNVFGSHDRLVRLRNS